MILHARATGYLLVALLIQGVAALAFAQESAPPERIVEHRGFPEELLDAAVFPDGSAFLCSRESRGKLLHVDAAGLVREAPLPPGMECSKLAPSASGLWVAAPYHGSRDAGGALLPGIAFRRADGSWITLAMNAVIDIEALGEDRLAVYDSIAAVTIIGLVDEEIAIERQQRLNMVPEIGYHRKELLSDENGGIWLLGASMHLDRSLEETFRLPASDWEALKQRNPELALGAPSQARGSTVLLTPSRPSASAFRLETAPALVATPVGPITKATSDLSWNTETGEISYVSNANSKGECALHFLPLGSRSTELVSNVLAVDDANRCAFRILRAGPFAWLAGRRYLARRGPDGWLIIRDSESALKEQTRIARDIRAARASRLEQANHKTRSRTWNTTPSEVALLYVLPVLAGASGIAGHLALDTDRQFMIAGGASLAALPAAWGMARDVPGGLDGLGDSLKMVGSAVAAIPLAVAGAGITASLMEVQERPGKSVGWAFAGAAVAVIPAGFLAQSGDRVRWLRASGAALLMGLGASLGYQLAAR